MIDEGGDGWQGATYAVFSSTTFATQLEGELLLSGTLEDVPAGSNWLCLADDCYELVVGGGSADSEIGFAVRDEHGGSFQDLQAPYSDHFCTSAGDIFEHPTFTPTVSLVPTPLPSYAPSALPTPSPTAVPTPLPSPAPSALPTPSPTAPPQPFPTYSPTPGPSPSPTTMRRRCLRPYRPTSPLRARPRSRHRPRPPYRRPLRLHSLREFPRQRRRAGRRLFLPSHRQPRRRPRRLRYRLCFLLRLRRFSQSRARRRCRRHRRRRRPLSRTNPQHPQPRFRRQAPRNCRHLCQFMPHTDPRSPLPFSQKMLGTTTGTRR